jgi:hypothetical protein
MHAVLVSVSIPADRQDEARERLQSTVVPGVKQLPGAMAGYWLEPTDGRGYSTVVFDSEENAKAAAETVRDRAPEFVTVDHIELREVVASF